MHITRVHPTQKQRELLERMRDGAFLCRQYCSLGEWLEMPRGAWVASYIVKTLLATGWGKEVRGHIYITDLGKRMLEEGHHETPNLHYKPKAKGRTAGKG